MGKDSEGKGSLPHELKRIINLFQAVMYGVGLILGAGIYVIIGDVAAVAGNAMWISFVVASVLPCLRVLVMPNYPQCSLKVLQNLSTCLVFSIGGDY